MGLDVYLYRYHEDPAEVDAICQQHHEETEAAWKEICGDAEWENVPESKKEKYREASKAISEKLGLKEYGVPPDEWMERVEINSAKHPEHMFKIGYFRSSYNPSGINYILSDRIGVDLYDLFDTENGEDSTPDWEAAKTRTLDALESLRLWRAEHGDVFVVEVSHNIFGEPSELPDKAEALRGFLKEKAEKSKGGEKPTGCYSSRRGNFFWQGLKAYAAIPGVSSLRAPAVFLMCEHEEDPNEDGVDFLDWYEQALEIVVETCDYALAHPDYQLRLSWSG
jgi:hypothetical protein